MQEIKIYNVTALLQDTTKDNAKILPKIMPRYYQDNTKIIPKISNQTRRQQEEKDCTIFNELPTDITKAEDTQTFCRRAKGFLLS